MLVGVAKKSLERCRDHLRRLTRRMRSGLLEEILEQVNAYTRGWTGYFRLADTPSVFQELDEWLRRRLRQLVWKRWKRGTVTLARVSGAGHTAPYGRARGSGEKSLADGGYTCGQSWL